MSLYSRLDRLAADVEKLNRQVTAVANSPQSQRTSVEGGSIDFNDADGNLMAIVGGQDDGSNTIRHVDGPTPPIPSGLSAHVDGPIVQVSWDGSFEDGVTATYDWSHLEVIVVGPGNEQLTATINDVTGASTSVAATASGEWTVVARSVSRAEKRSLDGDAGTVEVKLVDIDGAIDAVQDSANGKNKVTYSDRPPTPADPGIFDDTWFVGQVGRPEDIIEGRNLARNPGAHPDGTPWGWSGGSGVVAEMSSHTRGGLDVARATYLSGSSYLYLTSVADYSDPNNVAPVTPGDVISARMLVASSVERSVALRIGFRTASGGFAAWSSIGPYVSVPADGDLVELKIEAQTVPANAAYAYVHTTSAPGVGTWIEGTRAMFEVSPTVSTYFDGDTPSGATDNESHYRWTGEPHASTSEKYLPALNIGDSNNWNVIEQYRHDGAGWVKVELSHHVFSTVDLGKATVGELDGIRIMGQTIHGEQLSGDAIDGKVITGANIRTSQSGARVQMDVSGLRVFDSSDEQVVQLPSDGTAATFNGELVAKSLTSTGRASFLADNNRLEPGAGLVLAAGVGDPPSPPVVSSYYPTIEPPELGTEEAVFGLARADGAWWRAINVVGTFEGDRIERINDDGEVEHSFPTLEGDPRGLTAIGDELFLLAQKRNQGANRWVFVYDLNGNLIREWEYPNYGTGTYRPGIGRDEEGRVVIAQCWADGKLSWRTFTTTGSLVSTVTRDAPVKSGSSGIYIGNADFGNRRVVFAKDSTPGTNRQFTVYGTNGNDYFP